MKPQNGGGQKGGDGNGGNKDDSSEISLGGRRQLSATLSISDEDSDPDDEDDAAFVHALARRAPWVRALVDPLLGGTMRDSELASVAEEVWWCDVSIVYSKPGATNQDWHCDGRHLAGAPQAGFDGAGAASPYAVCVFCPLVDLCPTLGFTQFWAGSHRSAGLIGFGAAAQVLRGAVDGVVPAGGCVAYDYRLMHRGMSNTSEDTVRPVLQFMYAKQSYKETKNYGATSLFEPAVAAAGAAGGDSEGGGWDGGGGSSGGGGGV